MIRKFCDICNKEISTIIGCIIIKVCYLTNEKKYELCDDCNKEIQAIINKNKEMKDEK